MPGSIIDKSPTAYRCGAFVSTSVCILTLLSTAMGTLCVGNNLTQREIISMASAGLNKWIVSGNLAADAEVKTVDLKSGGKANVAEATLYVRGVRNREDSFTVSLSIWEKSVAWRKLAFLKKGSLIICTGSVEPNPFISKVDNSPKGGLQMNVLDVDLDIVRNMENESSNEATSEEESKVAAVS